MAEWFELHGRMEHAGGAERAALEQRFAELDGRMRAWPRTEENDPFHANSLEMAAQLSEAVALPVLVGFNEFCAPSLDDVLEQAIAQGAEKVVVVTPMMTRGGEHAQRDIPAAIQRVQERRPEVPIVYAWPFASVDVASFLAARIADLL
jgi:sirohydrochlorin cobaltochelatase